MATGDRIRIGLVVSEDDREDAEALAQALPGELRERIGGEAEWDAEVCVVEPADAGADPSELTAAVRRRLLDRGWQLGIGLTRLPLLDGGHPVTTIASSSHGVGIISLPALGALGRDERLVETVEEVVGALLGGGSEERLRRRSAQLATPRSAEDAQRDGALRFTRAVIGGNLRLLLGMIRANRPTVVMARLSRSSTAALGTGAYALTSSSTWTVAWESGWPRLLAIAVLSMAMILVALVIAHGLWERARDPAARERVLLFNVVTLTTLAIGIGALYVVLFVVLGLAAVIAIPPGAIERQLDAAPGPIDYARLAWFAASVATVGGALGSLVEGDEAVRDAAYRQQAGTPAE